MAKAILNGQKIFGNVHLGEGGGSAPVKILENGVISTDSSYATASFSDISDYEYVLIRFRTTVSGVDYDVCKYIAVSELSSEKTFSITLHRNVTVGLTTTTIRAIDYSGSYYYIYADIVGFTEDIFS